MPKLDNTTLQMALVGYEAERQKIRDKIAGIQRQLSGGPRRAGTPVAATPATHTRRSMSRRPVAE